jgi:hypothetical protein
MRPPGRTIERQTKWSKPNLKQFGEADLRRKAGKVPVWVASCKLLAISTLCVEKPTTDFAELISRHSVHRMLGMRDQTR